jgi:hypothetical protein
MQRKIITLSLLTVISSTLFADSIDDAFKNGKISGEVRSYYFQERQSDTGTSSIFNNGGYLNYLTGNYYGLSLGATLQVSSVLNTEGTNRFTYDEDASGAVLSESYISYTKNNSNFKIGRQYIGTPLLAGSGSRMIRQSFQGYTFTNTDIPNTELFLSYVDRFQMRTDANGNPGNFTKVFNTNRGVYERTLNDGAYTLLLTNKTIKNLTTNIQYLNAIDNFESEYFDATYTFGPIFVSGQYIGTQYDTNENDGNFIALKVGAEYKDFNFAVATSKTTSGDVESGLGYGADTSFTGNEIYGGIFSYRKDAKAYKVSLDKEIDKLKIGVAYVFTDMKDNKSNDQEIDLTGSYQFTKNLKLDLLHAIIDGSEDYSRAKADSETRIKVSYSF